MKKLLASILLLSYFVFSTGFVMSIHYCMDKINSVQLGDVSHDKCSKCGMHIAKSKGCCKDDVKVVKKNIDQAFAKTISPDFSYTLVNALNNFNYLFAAKPELPFQPVFNHGPPLSKQDTYLQNCVFRI